MIAKQYIELLLKNQSDNISNFKWIRSLEEDITFFIDMFIPKNENDMSKVDICISHDSLFNWILYKTENPLMYSIAWDWFITISEVHGNKSINYKSTKFLYKPI